MNNDFLWSCHRLEKLLALKESFMEVVQCCDQKSHCPYKEYQKLSAELDCLIKAEAKCLAVSSPMKLPEI